MSQTPAPKGFKALGKAAGFKTGGALDFCVLSSDVPAAAAGVFTRNRVLGAPVIVTKEHIAGGKLRAIVVNSRIANVATGQEGILTARRTCALAAESLGCDPKEIAVASTGVIGIQLPLDNMTVALDDIKSQLVGFDIQTAAKAIMTTDLVPKVAHARVGDATVVGIAKGSGMIAPNMATMLAFIMTDAKLDHFMLQAMLREAVDKSFNRISVDSDTSTSDMVLVMANGEAGPVDGPSFARALDDVCLTLAKMVARDGEGARRLVELKVTGAGDEGLAMRVARSVINSPLVKTAIYGADPNWGRIIAATGKVQDIRIDPEKISVKVGDDYVYFQGAPMIFDKAKAVAHLKQDEVKLLVDLGRGSAAVTVWGCDLSEDYIRINANYTS